MSARDVLLLLGVTLAGYMLGSFPTGVIVGRLWKGIDIRRHGSGHTGGLNIARVVGLPAGILVAVGDVIKGIAAILLAQALRAGPWAIPLAGFGAVVGHNWPLFTKLEGGLGLATLAGIFFLLRPELVPLAAIVFGVLYLILRDRPRAAAGMTLSPGPLLWALGAPTPLIALGVLGGGASFIKHVIEIRRGYKVLPLQGSNESD